MRRLDLVADCGSCAGLCCVVLHFDASEDFAFDKPGGVPCLHLVEHRCAIHEQRLERGFAGCAAYDCYGAGPRATRAKYANERERHAAFLELREVHHLLWLLTEASELCPPSHAELAAELSSTIAALDAGAAPSHEQAHALLRRVGDALGGRERARRQLIRAC